MSVFAEATNVKFFTEGLWCDEAFSWALASKGSALLPLTARDFNPPLYYLVLHAWMAIVGTSEVAMRSLSLAFFGLTLSSSGDICATSAELRELGPLCTWDCSRSIRC